MKNLQCLQSEKYLLTLKIHLTEALKIYTSDSKAFKLIIKTKTAGSCFCRMQVFFNLLYVLKNADLALYRGWNYKEKVICYLRFEK